GEEKAVDLDRLEVSRLDEAVKAQVPELSLEVVDRVVRKQDLRVLGDVRLQECGVEVVMVEVGDVQVVRVPDALRIDPIVGRKGKPGREIRRVKPRVTEDAAGSRPDEKACLAQESYVHLGAFHVDDHSSPRGRGGERGWSPSGLTDPVQRRIR